MYQRYAVYYAPRREGLSERAAAWLGWDPQKGAVEFAPFAGEDWAARVKDPQRYGFHGTIKAPFRLNERLDPSYLQARLDTFAAAHETLSLGALTLKEIHGFLALVPTGDVSELNAMAFATVKHLDDLRAPLSRDDIARRKPENLSPRQRELMQSWGYPFVAEEFKFHLTLTGRLEEDTLAETKACAERYFAEDCAGPFLIEDLCLFGEDLEGRFHLISRHPLGA